MDQKNRFETALVLNFVYITDFIFKPPKLEFTWPPTAHPPKKEQQQKTNKQQNNTYHQPRVNFQKKPETHIFLGGGGGGCGLSAYYRLNWTMDSGQTYWQDFGDLDPFLKVTIL